MVAAALAAWLLACAPAAVPPDPPAAPAQPRFMQVTAHADDDIIFMNPDLASGIRSGQPTVGIYLTAGETDKPDAADYAARRQAGTRAAYARMADRPDRWRSERLAVDDEHAVELYTLADRPEIQVVFVNLPEDNDPRAAGGKHALTRLWKDSAESVRIRTLVPTGGVVQESYTYTRSSVVELLTRLLARFQPTVVRAQDPAPDRRYAKNWVPYNDHPDHVVTARFAAEAADAYRRSGQAKRFLSFNYRQYNVDSVPMNLSEQQRRDKVGIFGTYAPHDSDVRVDAYVPWLSGMYYRWPRGTSWAVTGKDGSVYAFAVVGGELSYWQRPASGPWQGPRSLGNGGGPLAPAVSAVRDQAGRISVFARRTDTNAIVSMRQSTSDGDWPADWTVLGNPNSQPNAGGEAEVGAPAGLADDRGGLTVFVKNASGGLSSRRTTAGSPDSWEPGWTQLGGTDVQETPAALLTAAGRIELFAATTTKVLRWNQPTAGGQLQLDSGFASRRPAGTPSVLATPGQPAAVAYRVADTAEVVVRVLDQQQNWGAEQVVPGTPGGVGGPALATAGRDGDSRLLAFARGGDNGVRMSGQTKPGVFSGWTDLGGQLLDHPAATVDRDGRVVLVAFGPDGRLLTNQQSAQDASSGFTGWQPAGS